MSDYIKEINRYNECDREFGKDGERQFFGAVMKKYPEFDEMFKKSSLRKPRRRMDLMEFLMANSDFLNREENRWMKQIVQVVRNTSLFFQPQIRTKIMNEGWASYWHETLFLSDDRIKGHEVDFARVHAGVTSMPRVGLNPYALGMRLFQYSEALKDKGKNTYDFERVKDRRQRSRYDTGIGDGRTYMFDIRRNFNDFMFVSTFVDQDFINKHKLFVAGRRLNQAKMVWEYFVKSRKAEDYREMVSEMLYHPPSVEISVLPDSANVLYLNHRFEGKPLVSDYIAGTLLGIEYLWGAPVRLETREAVPKQRGSDSARGYFHWMKQAEQKAESGKVKWRRVVYTMSNRKLSKEVMD